MPPSRVNRVPRGTPPGYDHHSAGSRSDTNPEPRAGWRGHAGRDSTRIGSDIRRVCASAASEATRNCRNGFQCYHSHCVHSAVRHNRGADRLESRCLTRSVARTLRPHAHQPGDGRTLPPAMTTTSAAARSPAGAGIRPGTRVCVGRSKQTLIEFGDDLGCYFMDDRAPVAALLEAARVLAAREQRPAGKVYFVFTTSEEVDDIGGEYLSTTCSAAVDIPAARLASKHFRPTDSVVMRHPTVPTELHY